MEHFDLIVRNATLIDGTRAPRFAGDLGVRGDRIARIGRLDSAKADVEIDASGRIAAPGLLKITKGTPSRFDISAVRMRISTSGEPPAADGIMNRIGFSG